MTVIVYSHQFALFGAFVESGDLGPGNHRFTAYGPIQFINIYENKGK